LEYDTNRVTVDGIGIMPNHHNFFFLELKFEVWKGDENSWLLYYYKPLAWHGDFQNIK
jgi:hypothetical protein